MKIRSKAESLVADLFEDEMNLPLIKKEKTIVNPKFPWLLANIDRKIKGTNIILECKTSHPALSKNFGDEFTCEIPKYYITQVAHYCLVGDFDYAWVAVLIGLDDFRIYKYVRDHKFEMDYAIATRKFWYDFVDPSKKLLLEYPDITMDDSRLTAPEITTKDDLDNIFKTLDGSVVDASEEVYELVKEYYNVGKKLTGLTKHKKELSQTIKLFLGSQETITYLDEPIISNKSCKRKTVPVASLKKHFPKVYSSIVVENTHKRLTIKEGVFYE